MAVFDEIGDRRDAVSECMATVEAYRGSDLYVAVVNLLKAIEFSLCDDLREVGPDGLRYKQGAAKQCQVLRHAMIDGGNPLPKV